MEKRWVRVFVVTVLLGILLVKSIEGQVFDGDIQEMAAGVELLNTEKPGITEKLYDTEYLNNMEYLNDTELSLEIAEETVTETKEEEELSYIDYQVIDKDLLSKKSVDEVYTEQGKMEVCDYSEEVKGEFVPVVPKDCSFPEELVVMMEEVFYRSANTMLREAEDCYYDEKLKELGSDKFLLGLEDACALFPKIVEDKGQKKLYHTYEAYDLINELYVGDPRDCAAIFHFQMTEGQDNYLFSYYSGGTDRAIYVYLMERVGDEFIQINQFETEKYGRARLIQYGTEFYYVIMEFNQYMRNYDGIRVHRLNKNPKEDTLLIRYLPEEYMWQDLHDIYDNEAIGNETLEEINLYMEEMKKEFLYLDETQEVYGIPVHYLGFGCDYNMITTYYGDEQEAEIFNLREFPNVNESIGSNVDTVYKMDIANCGLPVYVSKRMTYSNSEPEYLSVVFIYYNSKTASYKELEQLSLKHGDTMFANLVQMWFKEFDGKIYIFRVYNVCDYNYVFNVLLLEGDQSTMVQTSVIAPRRKFVVTEGDVFHAGI